jgi:DNA-binding response OmpR family regulator
VALRRFSDMTENSSIADGRIRLDPELGLNRVVCDDEELALRPRVFNLLVALVPYVDTYRPVDDLAEELWGVSTLATRANLYVSANLLRGSFPDPELQHPTKGAIRSRRLLGIAAVSSLQGERDLWNEEIHEIIRSQGGELALNMTTQMTKVKSELVELSRSETLLLEYFMRNQSLLLSRIQLKDFMDSHGYESDDSNLNVAIRTLRGKLAARSADEKKINWIRSERRSGYVFEG